MSLRFSTGAVFTQLPLRIADVSAHCWMLSLYCLDEFITQPIIIIICKRRLEFWNISTRTLCWDVLLDLFSLKRPRQCQCVWCQSVSEYPGVRKGDFGKRPRGAAVIPRAAMLHWVFFGFAKLHTPQCFLKVTIFWKHTISFEIDFAPCRLHLASIYFNNLWKSTMQWPEAHLGQIMDRFAAFFKCWSYIIAVW